MRMREEGLAKEDKASGDLAGAATAMRGAGWAGATLGAFLDITTVFVSLLAQSSRNGRAKVLFMEAARRHRWSRCDAFLALGDRKAL